MRASIFVLIALLAFLFMPVPQAMSATPARLATVSGTLNPGDTKEFTYNLPRGLEDFLLHVTVTASNPQTDTLDITPDVTIPDATWTDLQGDWWDYWANPLYGFEPLTAGDHTLAAATGPDATGSISFEVEFLQIPTPPFTIRGTFPANSGEVGMNVAYIHVDFPKGNCSIAAEASTGSFTLFPEGLDAIDVSGPINQTLHFPDAGVYEFQVQTDPTGPPTSWSITFGEAVIPEFPQAGLAFLLPVVLAVTLVLLRRRGQRSPAP
jgi:hypothetical protein